VAVLSRQLKYLDRMCVRMQIEGWPLTDPVCRQTLRTRRQMQALGDAVWRAGDRK